MGSGSRKVVGKAIDRIIDALSPYKQRASAAIQTQTAAGVSDIARNVDLMEPVVDTSRLQELMMPRLRAMLKQQAGSRAAEGAAHMLQKRLTKQSVSVSLKLMIVLPRHVGYTLYYYR